MPWLDLAGHVFGRWTAIARHPPKHWRCRCRCGTEKIVATSNLRAGISQSCGCLQVELSRQRHTTHGAAAFRRLRPEYKIWQCMKNRCLNPRARDYRYYGGRGITVAAEWVTSFPAFLAAVGPRPTPQHTIDRVNNDGHYEPGNVRWATWAEQRTNKRPRSCHRHA